MSASLDEWGRAIANGDVVTAERVIKSGIDVNRSVPGFRIGAPALVLAADRGHAAIVTLLLNNGARINHCNSDKQTACHAAAANGDPVVLAVLIAHHADLSLKNRDRNSCLALAISSGREPAVVMLIKAGAPLDVADEVCRAAAMGVAAAQAIIDRGVALSTLRSRKGDTPCHIVTRLHGDRIDLLQMLVRVGGVDVNARNDNGQSLVHIVAYRFPDYGTQRLLRWLFDEAADVDGPDRFGTTPLHMACQSNNLDVALALLAVNCDVHARSASMQGETACHIVVRHPRTSSREYLCWLLACGADFDAVSNVGISARQSAAERDVAAPTPAEIEAARRHIARVRLDYVRHRAFQICVGLQARGLDALQLCEILVHACGPIAAVISFHHWWKIATTVKHFQRGK